MNKKPRNYIKKKPIFDNTKHDGGDSSKIKKLKCFYCEKLRHIFKNCEKIVVVKVAKSTTKQENVAIGSDKLYVVALITRNGKDPTLCLDIGATQHMAHDKNTLIYYQTLNIGQVVYLANDSTHQNCGCGDVSIMLNNGLRKEIFKVFHVLGLMKNLFSIKQFDLVGGKN
jgi:hypothetical protein